MKRVSFLIIMLFISLFGFAQIQLGNDIDGESEGDNLGYSISISSAGDIIATGALSDHNGQYEVGSVKVYKWDGVLWQQLGEEIVGKDEGDTFGNSVSLSSAGDIIAIGAPGRFRQGFGYVRICSWDGTSWEQRGNDIVGEEASDQFGRSVSLSSAGDVVAIGAIGNDGNGESSGHVRVFAWDGTSWVQRGSDIDGEAAGDNSGTSVSLSSSGHVVAIGAIGNDGNGESSGHVRVFAWDGTSWAQRGDDIDGKSSEDFFGNSVSLSSSGDTVAIGARERPFHDTGYVRVYTWDGFAWLQLGDEIVGEELGDQFGHSISISASGKEIGVGAHGIRGGPSIRVKFYRYDGNSWLQKGGEIDRGAIGTNYFGSVVSLSASGDILVSGTPKSTPLNIGNVRVYQLDGIEYLPIVQVSEEKNQCQTPRILPYFEYEYFQQGKLVGRYILQKDKGILIPIEDSSRIRPRILPVYNSLPEYYLLDSASVASRIIGTLVRDTFCLLPRESVYDVQVTIVPVDRARPGFENSYLVNIENIGTQEISGTLEFYYEESLIDYVSSVPMANQVITGSVLWDYSNLLPFEKRSYEVTLKLNGPMDNPPLMGGETIVLKSKIEPISGDIDTTNNYVECYQVVVNSWDPNDKRCLSGDTLSPSDVGSELVYMIRFENEGTAEAENVIVTDYIDTATFEINSFRLIESSHSQTTQITRGNRVDFLFDDINLPFDDANNDGYVVFGIKSKSSLLIGDTLKNRASIYFDYNLPIVTNDAITLVADQPTNSKNYHKDNSVKVYPNPSNEAVWISSNSAIERIEVFDMNGRQMSSYVYLDGWQKDRELNVREFMPGVYVLVVKTREGLQQTKLIVN